MSDIPTLEELIAAVEHRQPKGDSLALLTEATQMREGLDALSDALLDHFVEAARGAGCSWSDIGGALGVSKQAAQQRHAGEQSGARRLMALLGGVGRTKGAGLFGGRFTTEARETVIRAQSEARELGHSSLGSEHLLLGLLSVGGTAAEVLESLDVAYADVRSRVVDLRGQGAEPVPGHIPFTPRAKTILELALREGLNLKSKVLGPEHVLLGMVREGEGSAMQVLMMLGADARIIRQAVLDRIDEQRA